MEGEAPPATPAAPAGSHAEVDSQHPWLGLASFTEETRQYFYGREEEVAELCRRVQRKILTVLFGQSGLGKTSILRAGIVPRLRPDGYCPIYVRIDYSPESPTPAEQIKEAIFRATHAAGAWTQTGVAVEGESLWEFLHHRDDVLRDASGKPLIPLLIFDQFEEIFTLAQSDDRGRQRAAQFLEDLADLVENRPPKALEAKLDSDESAVDQFDFARADYRILIALREDYLAHLEGVKGIMPSITQNRMRLARMTGQQALAAVLKPGGRLVSEEVAAAIVRFTAGGSELRNAEVEPSLLSLICRELNNARIAQGRSEISADLLAGSHDTILAEFYERALADQPPAVRHVVEDQLLTESGFRESLAEERLLKAFASAGAASDALAKLVDRRLLRIEERLDVRRVELTHDVLCSVVKGSRDLRIAREAQEAAEAALAAQRARERATRKALIRARQIAAGCAVLAVVAAGSAVFGFFATKRAQQAEAQAQATKALAERARGEAEELIVYLLDDFQLELEPVGRLDIVAELARRTLHYYRQLPPELRTPQTERNRALALVRYGAVLRYQAKIDESAKALDEGTQVLTKLLQQGDASEATVIGLAMGRSAQARVATSRNDFAEAARLAEVAAAVITPLAGTPSPSVAVRRAYAGTMVQLGFIQQRRNQEEAAVKSLQAARAASRSIDDLALGDLAAAAEYTEAASWEVDALRQLGRHDEARRVGAESLAVAERILEKRPGHMPALRAHALLASGLSNTEDDSLNLAKALEYSIVSEHDWKTYRQIDPTNAIAWNNQLATGGQTWGLYWRMGRITEALQKVRSMAQPYLKAELPAMIAGNLAFTLMFQGILEADAGNRRESEAAFADARRLAAGGLRDLPEGSLQRTTIRANLESSSVARLLLDLDHQAQRAAADALAKELEGTKPTDASQERFRNIVLRNVRRQLAVSSYRLGDYRRAEEESRRVMALLKEDPPATLNDRRDASDDGVLLALALARLERAAEAREVIAPELAFQRELAARRDNDDMTQRIQLAGALYASALAGDPKRAAQLREAAALLDALPPQMRALRSTATLRGWIADEQKRG